MSVVKRYDLHSSFGGAEIVERSYGDYVLHYDYEADTSALLARIAELEKEATAPGFPYQTLKARIASLEREKEDARDKDDRNKIQRVSDGYKQVYNETYAELTSLREVVENVRKEVYPLTHDVIPYGHLGAGQPTKIAERANRILKELSP